MKIVAILHDSNRQIVSFYRELPSPYTTPGGFTVYYKRHTYGDPFGITMASIVRLQYLIDNHKFFIRKSSIVDGIRKYEVKQS